MTWYAVTPVKNGITLGASILKSIPNSEEQCFCIVHISCKLCE